ncbi:MAG: hypothetical protein O7C63_06465 [Alphaproteobacteria bacterium]|nr:hypothetical protein [Alphaproteobacteria bacterium]
MSVEALMDDSWKARERGKTRDREAIKAEEAAKQRTRLLRFATIASVVFAILAVVALFQWYDANAAREDALVARDEATAARDEANVAKDLAEFQTHQAEQQRKLADAARFEAEKAGAEAIKARDEAKLSAAEATAARKDALAQRDVSLALQGELENTLEKVKEAEVRALDQLRQARIAQSRLRASKAVELAGQSDYGTAIAVALTAMPQANAEGWPKIGQIPEVANALTTALLGLKERLVFRGHQGWVLSAAFSPDGARIVTASLDSTARIWDAKTGAEITVLRGHEDKVISAAFSPDGARIVTASRDNTARIWNNYPSYDDLYRAGAEVVERLKPLTTKEECAFYLRTEGCER